MSLNSMISLLFILICLSVSVYLTVFVWSGIVFLDEREFVLEDSSEYLINNGISRHKVEEIVRIDINVSGKIHHKCKEKRNFVFIKCMKCATETMATIIRRFGYYRNLSFVLPVKGRIYLGWPYLMTHYDHSPSSHGYNIIMEHSIYNKSFQKNLMPQNTVYISIIREPFSHVKSVIHYFKILELTQVKGNDPLGEYFNNLQKYEDIYKSPETYTHRYCIPDGFSITKNLLSHCLGMPLGFPPGREDITNDQVATQNYIGQLDGDFYLIMLVEYFHESLVLLKRKMCWTFYDIIYKSVNSKAYYYKNITSHPELVNFYKNWSRVDYQLYGHFNKSFWSKVREQSSDFFDEVAEFSKIQTNVTLFCRNSSMSNMRVENSEWSPGFNIVRKDCKMLWSNLLKRIKKRQYEEEKELIKNQEGVTHPLPKPRC